MPCMIWVAIIIEAAIQNWPDFGVLLALQAINGSIGLCGATPPPPPQQPARGDPPARCRPRRRLRRLRRSYEASKAGDAVAALKKSLKPSAVCKRDGKWANIDAALLVPGDLVGLNAGAAVPADCRINHGRLDVDQSALTGPPLLSVAPHNSLGRLLSCSAPRRAARPPGESLPVTMTGGSQPKMGSTVSRGEVEATVEARCSRRRGRSCSAQAFSANLLRAVCCASCSRGPRRSVSALRASSLLWPGLAVHGHADVFRQDRLPDPVRRAPEPLPEGAAPRRA